MSDDKKQKSKMLEIRDVLKSQMSMYSNLHKSLSDTSKDFDKINETYTVFDSEIDMSKSHISKLQKREYLENLFIYVGFFFFFICVIWVMLKRFPIHRIIFLLYSISEYIIISIFSILTQSKEQLSLLLSTKQNITENITRELINLTSTEL